MSTVWIWILRGGIKMLDKTQLEIWNALCELSGEEVLNLLTDWHGTQLLDEKFKEFLEDEGVM
jgi:hypothetical protein